MSITEPKLEYREEQPYVAIRTKATMQEMGTAAHLMSEVFPWLAKQGIAPAGAPFMRYIVVDMENQLELDVGVPVATTVAGEGRISSGSFPAGRYAVMLYTGPYDGLVDATARLQAWAEENGVKWQASEDKKNWAARIEYYLTDPNEEPDPQKWQTELAFLTAS